MSCRVLFCRVIWGLFLLFAGFIAPLTAQNQVRDPEKSDFVPQLKALSAARMTGRETGTDGGWMASNFIAEYQRQIGLQPMSDDFFQPFEVIRYRYSQAKFELLPAQKTSDPMTFRFEEDFTLIPCQKSFSATADVLFAGYGMISPDSVYNDFRGLEVKGKIVMVLEGYPGESDSIGMIYQLYGKPMRQKGEGLEAQKRNAMHYGASALILLKAHDNSLSTIEWFQSLNGQVPENYPDWRHLLASDSVTKCIPVFAVGEQGSERLSGSSRKELAAGICEPNAKKRKNPKPLRVHLEAVSQQETFEGYNVIGLIRGNDSSRCVVIGGHYDHLGQRGDSIFFGADDNASGASGVLALAKKWKESGIRPAVDLIFANWDGEEKGLLGSRAFVGSLNQYYSTVVGYINMDMISRSEAADTAARIVSVGLKSADSLLNRFVVEANQHLPRPLTLDIWDASGHSGSDYGPFLNAGYPILTFFTGFHDDYHSPRDRFEKIDSEKMEDILALVNRCIQYFEKLSRPAKVLD